MTDCHAEFQVNGESQEAQVRLRGSNLNFIVDESSPLNLDEGATIRNLVVTVATERNPLRTTHSGTEPVVDDIKAEYCRVSVNNALGNGRHAIDLIELKSGS